MKEIIRKSLRNRLTSLMSDISETHMCAGWLIGLEYTLWEAVQAFPTPFYFGGKAIDSEDVEELKALSDELKEWGVFDMDPDAPDHRTIPLIEWLERYEHRRTR